MTNEAKADRNAERQDGEEWRSVAELGLAAAYEVSSLGRVRRAVPRFGDGVIAGSTDRYGYHRVHLSGGECRVTRRTHRLVCEAFHGPPPGGAHAAHLDGDRTNNGAGNVAWATPQENAAHKSLHGTNHGNGGMPGERHPCAKLTVDQVREIRAATGSTYAIARQFGISQGQAFRIRKGTRWSHVDG